MPRRLDLGNLNCPPQGSRGLARLFERPLGPVKVVKMHRGLQSERLAVFPHMLPGIRATGSHHVSRAGGCMMPC